MAKRTSNIATMVEYVDSTNYKRTTTILAMVEYVDVPNYKRTGNIMLMVEYTGEPIIGEETIKGPKVQFFT